MERKKSLLSKVTTALNAHMKGFRKAFRNMGKTLPPIRDIVATISITVIAFAAGFFVGTRTQQPVLPRDFVTIQEIDVHGTSPSLADSEEEVVQKDTEAQAIPASREVDTGVVGPVPSAASPAEAVKPQPSQPRKVAPSREEMIMPIEGRIASNFGWRKHPVYQDWRYHTGIDIETVEGREVKAALSGKVIQVDSLRELGQYVVIEHADGISTKYGHLSSVSVNRGDSVKQGQTIGKAGSSGVTSGTYLHFEVNSAEAVRDPQGFL